MLASWEISLGRSSCRLGGAMAKMECSGYPACKPSLSEVSSTAIPAANVSAKVAGGGLFFIKMEPSKLHPISEILGGLLTAEIGSPPPAR